MGYKIHIVEITGLGFSWKVQKPDGRDQTSKNIYKTRGDAINFAKRYINNYKANEIAERRIAAAIQRSGWEFVEEVK